MSKHPVPAASVSFIAFSLLSRCPLYHKAYAFPSFSKAHYELLPVQFDDSGSGWNPVPAQGASMLTKDCATHTNTCAALLIHRGQHDADVETASNHPAFKRTLRPLGITFAAAGDTATREPFTRHYRTPPSLRPPTLTPSI